MGRFVHSCEAVRAFLLLILSIGVAMGSESLVQWVSPHSLRAESEAPVALLPFPRAVKWGKEVRDLPPSPRFRRDL